MEILKNITSLIKGKYESLREIYKAGERKAFYENCSGGAPTLMGAGSPSFDKWVEEVFAPYRKNTERAKAISEPTGLIKRLLFRIGYKGMKLN